MVSQMKLHQMQQDHEESVTTFATRLREQAAICLYQDQPANCTGCATIPPPHYYGTIMIRDILLGGLANPDIQQDVLSNANQNMMLEEAITFVATRGWKAVPNQPAQPRCG
jgi:hypothetical protein